MAQRLCPRLPHAFPGQQGRGATPTTRKTSALGSSVWRKSSGQDVRLSLRPPNPVSPRVETSFPRQPGHRFLFRHQGQLALGLPDSTLVPRRQSHSRPRDAAAPRTAREALHPAKVVVPGPLSPEDESRYYGTGQGCRGLGALAGPWPPDR